MAWHTLRDLLDGLRKRGFKLNFGIHDSGLALLALSRARGFYIGTLMEVPRHLLLTHCLADTGGSQLIADGKIGLRSGPQIECFTEHGINFDDGSYLEADVVIFATGYSFFQYLGGSYTNVLNIIYIW